MTSPTLVGAKAGAISATNDCSRASVHRQEPQQAQKIVRRRRVVSLNCRDAFPQMVDTDAPGRATHPRSEAERDRTTARSSSRHDLSVWPPSLAGPVASFSRQEEGGSPGLKHL